MHQTMKVMAVALLSGILALGTGMGCAGRTTTTAQTTTTEESAPATETGEPQPPHPAVQTTTTTTTTESDHSSPGIIGSAFLFVWAVVSFPFRVIGALV